MCDGKFDTREVLERAFRNYFQDEHLGIMSFDVQPAVAVGDNYTSNMLRVDVKYLKSQNQNEESMSVLVKVQLSDLSMSIIYDELNLFAKEMEMFGKTLPLMYEVLGLEREESLSAPCLLTTDDPLPILVLKDLKPFGYKMSSRQTGLDFEHCKLVLEKLAKFHAASAVIVNKDPSLVKNYPSGMYNEGQVLGPWINKGITSLIKVCKIWPGMEKYAVKLEKYLEELEKRGKTAASRGMELGEMDGFKVINHGDVWTNNLLFQYDDNNKPINIKFVDFQIAHYSSPVLDVHFFFATSADIEVHRKYIGTLLEHYFHHFSNTMSSISNNSLKNAFDWTSFIEEYKRRSFHGILAATSVAPAARADNRDDANFENLTQDEEDGNFRHHCFNNDIFREFMEVYIPYLDSLGALEYK